MVEKEEEYFISELEKKRNTLMALKEHYITLGGEVRAKIAKAKSDAYVKGKYVDSNTFHEWEKERIENGQEQQRLQNEIGALTRQIKKNEHDEHEHKEKTTKGMFDRLFVNMCKESYPKVYDDLFLEVKIKMMDL